LRVTTNKIHNNTTHTNAIAKMISAIPHPLTPPLEEAARPPVSLVVADVGGSVVVSFDGGCVVGGSVVAVVFVSFDAGVGAGVASDGVGAGVAIGVGAGVVEVGVVVGVGVGAGVVGGVVGVGTGVGAGV
jgi:hypothetical protein